MLIPTLPAAANPSLESESSQNAGTAGYFEGAFTEFLPEIFSTYNQPTVFGVEMTTGLTGPILTLLDAMGSKWMRHNGLLWSEVEPVNNRDYQWASMAGLESKLIATTNAGMSSVLIIRSTPDWAALIPNEKCGPMKSQYFDDFGDFIVAAVNRYSGPPYFVRTIEIWNEPDVEASQVPSDQLFGCWGNKNDTYYGGEFYGEMLKVVYPMVKNANPAVQVLIGGLLLDCDPRNPPAGQTCKPAKFLEGILQAGAKNSFDGVSFHAYDYYNPVLNTFGNPNWKSGQLNGETNGVMRPVSIAKAGFINEVLAAYNVTGKYLMNTESALLCGSNFDPPGGPGCEPRDDSPYEIMKAAYLAQAYSSAKWLNFKANLWFTFTGWRNSGLINSDKTPRLAYYAFDFSESMLSNAKFTGVVTGYFKVAGYKFLRLDGTTVWVMWATDGGPRGLALPSVPLAIWDANGDPVAINGVSATMTIEPLYIMMP